MDQQLSLFDTPKQVPARYSVFLAVMPELSVARRILELAAELQARHGLRGRLRPLDHLHVTLHHIGYYPEVPEHVVRAVDRACEAVAAVTPAFEAKFDEVLSFGNRPGNHPLVLVDQDGGKQGLSGLHQVLARELIKQALPVAGGGSFTPHITLLYDQQKILKEPVDPVGWRVDEIILIRSEVGATKYQYLGRWTLGMGNVR